MIDLKINSHPISFKIDTGAAVTAVPSSLRKCIPNVRPSGKMLKGAGNNRLIVTGQANTCLSLGDKEISENVYFVENLVTPLLGKPAISKLGLIKFDECLDTVLATKWPERFSKLFQGLGTMDSKVSILLDPQISPYIQSVPRRVAAARKKPLLDELRRMESLGVIEKVEEPTDWCAPCLVVPKKNGKLRVCIDFTNLNKAVKREYHPLPTVEETLGELGDSRVFSKLDANCGYWQMKLHKDSQKLTTFITPFGRYYCKRLPFGISSAPEIFQREMQKIMVDLEGVVCQMDDVLVHGRNQSEHDERLQKVLSRLEKAGITLNRKKCEFSVSETKFLGHIVDSRGVRADPEKTKGDFKFPYSN